MKFQPYKEKMAVLFKTASFPTTDSSLLITPMENLSFDELHNLCKCDNIVMVECPSFSFNFGTMSIESSHDIPKVVIAKKGFTTDPLVKPIHVSSFQFKSMEDFYENFWNEKDLFFFYSGVKVNGFCNLRMAKIEYEKIEKAIKRYEAIVRLNTSINIKNSVENIVSYVNSETFKNDMQQANVDVNEIARDLYEMYKVEPQPGENVPPVSPIERMTAGINLQTEMDLRTGGIYPTGVIDNDAFTNEKEESDGENSCSHSGEGH